MKMQPIPSLAPNRALGVQQAERYLARKMHQAEERADRWERIRPRLVTAAIVVFGALLGFIALHILTTALAAYPACPTPAC